MRSITIVIAALALGSAPAAAQNNVAETNVVAADNEVVADVNTAAPAPVNDLTAPPQMPGSLEPPEPAEDGSVATTDRDGGFPWGLIGLVGLVGLLGRSRR